MRCEKKWCKVTVESIGHGDALTDLTTRYGRQLEGCLGAVLMDHMSVMVREDNPSRADCAEEIAVLLSRVLVDIDEAYLQPTGQRPFVGVELEQLISAAIAYSNKVDSLLGIEDA